MSFTTFPRHSANDHSKWTRQAAQPGDATNNSIGDRVLSTNQSQDTPQNDGQLHSIARHTQAKKALIQRRSLDVNLDPALCQLLMQDSAETASQKQQQLQNDKYMATTSSNNIEDNDTAMGIKGTKSQVNKLKSSFRQVVSAPTSPSIGGKRGGGGGSGKSVKFDPFHLEKVCVFQGSHSPSQVPRSDGIQRLPFKVVYSHWPPIQHTLFQHEQNVQLKRSLKILDGGSTLHGQVLVRNLGYEKQVEIRYTLDGWKTVNNVMAEYRHSRGSLDIFAYDIPLEQGMADRGYLRATVDLAVRYTVTMIMNGDTTTNNNNYRFRLYQHGAEETFWDNNDGHNYQIHVVDTASGENEALATSSFLVAPAPGGDASDLPHYLDTDPLLSISPMASSSGSRYDFGESLIKAKHKMKPGMNTTGTDNNHHSSALDNQMTPLLPWETQSAPSSPRTDLSHSRGNQSLTSSSYSDLVKKYCFYGSQDTSTSSPPALSING